MLHRLTVGNGLEMGWKRLWCDTNATRSAPIELATSVLNPPLVRMLGKRDPASTAAAPQTDYQWARPERDAGSRKRDLAMSFCCVIFDACCARHTFLWRLIFFAPLLRRVASKTRLRLAFSGTQRRSRLVAVQLTPTGADSAGVLHGFSCAA